MKRRFVTAFSIEQIYQVSGAKSTLEKMIRKNCSSDAEGDERAAAGDAAGPPPPHPGLPDRTS
jgi:hypothetical protein